MQEKTKKIDPLKIINALLWVVAFSFTIATLVVLWRWSQDYPIPTYLFILMPIATLLAFLAQKLSREAKYNLTLLTISLIVSAYAVEGFLTGYGNPKDFDNKRFVGALSSGILYDQRHILDVVKDMREDDPNVVPFVSSGNFSSNKKVQTIRGEQIFPLGHIANTTTVFCNELGYYITYESDEHGFRGNAGIWQTQPDIAIIGDSFAQGACVEDGDHIAAYLRQTYPNTLNLGVSGVGPLIELAMLKEYVEPYQPPLVVWLYFEANDFLDLQDERNNPFLRQYLGTDFRQDLINRQDDINTVRQEYMRIVEQSRDGFILMQDYPTFWEKTWTFMRLYEVRRLLGVTFETPLEVLPPEDPIVFEGNANNYYEEALDNFPENLRIMKQVFGEANALVSSWGGEMVVVYIPGYDRHVLPDLEEWSFHRTDMLRVWNEEQITVLDLRPVLQDHSDPLSLYPYRLDGHFNKDGYAFLGEQILEYIQENELLSK